MFFQTPATSGGRQIGGGIIAIEVEFIANAGAETLVHFSRAAAEAMVIAVSEKPYPLPLRSSAPPDSRGRLSLRDTACVMDTPAAEPL